MATKQKPGAKASKPKAPPSPRSTRATGNATRDVASKGGTKTKSTAMGLKKPDAGRPASNRRKAPAQETQSAR